MSPVPRSRLLTGIRGLRRLAEEFAYTPRDDADWQEDLRSPPPAEFRCPMCDIAPAVSTDGLDGATF